jgi:hypothetical protein
METQKIRIGARVRVSEDYIKPQLRGCVGTIERIYGENHPTVEVYFEGGRLELFGFHQLERMKEPRHRSSWQRFLSSPAVVGNPTALAPPFAVIHRSTWRKRILESSLHFMQHPSNTTNTLFEGCG